MIWRIRPGAVPEIWSKDLTNFPNGLAVAPDDSRLYVLESFPGALVEVPIDRTGSAGERRVLHNLETAVPDGIALAEDGALYVACYRPDAVYRWHPHEGLTLVAEDPRGTVLAAPTNIIFSGQRHDEIIVPNIGRWHLTRIPVGVRGIPLNYPTRRQMST
jgi:gluconolactonase